MTSVRALESPLRAWRAFRDIARATRTLAAAQALQWAEQARHADAHLAWCDAAAAICPIPEIELRPRVVLVLGTDLGLCGPLNHRLAELCRTARLDAPPTILRVVVGARLATLTPLTDAVVLPAPSSLVAAQRLAAEIEDLIARLPDSLTLDLNIVIADAVEADGSPCVALRTSASPDLELAAEDREWVARPRAVLGRDHPLTTQAHTLARHARIVAALCRAVTSENEARLRTMSRAYESAQRRIAEQERKLRKLRQELITQEMLEARQGGRT